MPHRSSYGIWRTGDCISFPIMNQGLPRLAVSLVMNKLLFGSMYIMYDTHKDNVHFFNPSEIVRSDSYLI
jgi:hypothetical protein